MEKESIQKGDKKQWLKKLGVIGFMFFLLKGLAWIGVAIWAWWQVKK